MVRNLLLFLFCLPCILLSAQPTEVQYLSGRDKDHTVDWEFYIDHGRNSGKWTTIPVPSNWELEGFGVYNYGRGENEESDETARYRYRFRVPASWNDRVVRIVFEGVMTDTKVEINGRSAGPVHQGGFYRFAYDVTDLLAFGEENRLEVVVKNWSDNESVNAAERQCDYWVFGGIYRPVYLEAKPRAHIDWTAIDARADGQFTLLTYLNNIDRAGSVEAQILTPEGRPVGAPFSAPAGPGSERIRLETSIQDPLVWSPEFPHRHQVRIRLKQGSEIRHEVIEKFGFRTVELRPRDGIYVNGAKVIFKAVNRHSSWPESGRCMSRELSILDVELMKDMNMNTVRMSHYPPDVHFLEVCDSLGLFVLDELAGWQDAYDTEAGEKLVREMVIRDLNHPSIIIWDNGNEGGFNPALDDDFHIYDLQKRPVIHPWARFRHTDTQHYIDYDCCTNAAFHSPDIFFPTEFLHGLYDGGHGAGLEDFWDLMRERPLASGGFLWVFADEGVVRTDQNERIDTWGSNAPDGIVGPYREKEGSYFTIREIWSPVYLEAPPNMDFFEGHLHVENRYMYTNLNQCRFDWQWMRFPGPADRGTEPQVLAAGRGQGPELAPGESGRIPIERPREWRQSDALRVTITDPHGKEVFTYSFPVRQPAELVQSLMPSEEAPGSLQREAELVVLSSGGVQVRLDTLTGTIREVKSRGRNISLHGGPVIDPHLGNYELEKVVSEPEGKNNAILFQFTGKKKEASKGIDWKVQYTMLAGGWLRLDYEYLPAQGQYDYLGINFNYPEEKIKGIRWLGKGPYRVWKNRMKGPQIGVWQKEYNNTITGETLWVYPEFKGYHANLYWAVIDNEEQPFLIATETPGLFLRLYTPPAPQGAYNDHTDGIFPQGAISLLHAISPIGTKFKSADKLGPQGQPNRVFYNPDVVPFRATIYFHFGER